MQARDAREYAGEQQSRQNSPRDAMKEAEKAKIERIAGQTAGLVEDLKSWFELKMEFILLNFKDEVKSIAKEEFRDAGKEIAFHIAFAALLLIAAFFILMALAFGLGAWLGHPGWGFLAVAGILSFIALIVRVVAKRQGRRKKAAGKVPLLEDTQNRLPPSTTAQIPLNDIAPDKTPAPRSPELTTQKATTQPAPATHGKDQ